jgi:hypothetical protein
MVAAHAFVLGKAHEHRLTRPQRGRITLPERGDFTQAGIVGLGENDLGPANRLKPRRPRDRA